MRVFYHIKTYLVILSCLFVFSDLLTAGQGRIIEGNPPSTPHKLNLIVAFLYDETSPNGWENTFNNASRLLYNATEKQMQLGTVTVYNNCSNKKRDADIYIIEDLDFRAWTTPLGLCNNELKDSFAFCNLQHIYISQNSLFLIPNDTIGYLTIVHEFGHYVFGLKDEYKGFALPSVLYPGYPEMSPSEEYFCTSTPGFGTASIMDAGSKSNIDRTEFCTDPDDGFSTSHQSGYESNGLVYFNDQEFIHHESSWETIVKNALDKYGINMSEPTTEPIDDDSGHENIVFDLRDCKTRSVVSIDTSSSMAGDRLDLAKKGASLYIDLVNLDEDLGVTSFNTTSSVVFTLQNIDDISKLDSARAGVESLIATGGTSIGDGLRTSLDEILNNTSRSDNEVIVLLSDGFHNTGENPNSVIPDLITQKVKVHTVALGAGSDINTLQDIASQTGGEFFFAETEADLSDIFASISALAQGNGIIKQFSDFISSGGQIIKEVFVDSYTESVDFILTWPGSDLDLKLIRPDGQMVDADFAAANPGTIEYVSRGSYEFFRVKTPLSGIWQVVVDAIEVEGQIPLSIQVFESSPNVLFDVITDKDSYFFPEKVHVQALVSADAPIAGVDVSGTVLRPDGSVFDIILYDDGSIVHGDDLANDGIYSNFFSAYNGNNGVYVFSLIADNKSGVLASPIHNTDETNNSHILVEPFSREAEVTVNVSGVPPCLDTDGDGFTDATCGGEDCDDADDTVNPGALEICNGVDDNCDGLTDETFDVDGDGFFTPACGGDDCDDTNSSINSDAAEVCNQVDDDCDGFVDEGFDVDSDGFTTCGGDCDDSVRAVNPGMEEQCFNGVDDDCDGMVDCDDEDDDNDLVDDVIEDGAPNNGDGNNDGTKDSLQKHVVSIPNAVDGRYVTLETDPKHSLFNVNAVLNPSPGNVPDGISFPIGFFEFEIALTKFGEESFIVLYLPEGVVINSFYKFGPTPDNPVPHWYDFIFDGETGAQFLEDRVVLRFVDGKRGDDDITINGMIVEPGGPGFMVVEAEQNNTNKSGCSIASSDNQFSSGVIINLLILFIPVLVVIFLNCKKKLS